MKNAVEGDGLSLLNYTIFAFLSMLEKSACCINILRSNRKNR